jgi:uncharacterized delta-60 repeat protein
MGYVRIDIDGTVSSTQERATDVAVQPDGKIVVVGNLQRNADLSGSVMVARLNTDGTLDSTFGAGGIKLGTPLAGTGYHYFRANAVALQSNGNIIVGGVDNWGTTGDTSRPLLMRFFGSSTGSALPAFGGAAVSAGVTQAAGRLPVTVAFDTGGATATPSTGVPGFSTDFVLERGPKVVRSAHTLSAPGTTAAAISTTVASAPGLIFVPQVLDDHPFPDAVIAGKRRRSS